MNEGCRPDWFVRDNLEFDEKLPLMSKEVVLQGVDFGQFNTDGDVDDQVVTDMMETLKYHLECFEDLTADEVEYFLGVLAAGCELSVMVDEGILDLDDNGKLFISDSLEDIYP